MTSTAEIVSPQSAFSDPLPDHARVAIVGSGFAGIGMAVKLKEAGIEDFVILERASDVGGTWRDNTYPGCRCDIPSHLYSFSFDLNPEWSDTYSPQPEIWDYIRRSAQRFDVNRHVRCEAEVMSADWDEEAQVWRIGTARGTMTADFLVAAMGGLSEPSVPDLPGLERFGGASFHSAQWDHDHDLAGEKVAVIGTGASAIQFVPEIQPEVERLTVFQRTAPWVMPATHRAISAVEHRLFKRVPGLQRLMRAGIYWSLEALVVGLAFRPRLMKAIEALGRRHIAAQVSDRELRRRVTPNYRMGCKRILKSNDWYPALQQPNVELVTTGIREITEHGVIDAEGVEHEADTIIFGTGFKVMDLPVAHRVRGVGGTLLVDSWEGSPEAYLGTAIAGMPNLFVLVGPNTGLGHNSIVFMIESQVRYVVEALREVERRGVASIDVRPEVQAAYNAELQEKMEGTVWSTGGCSSWYLDAEGRNFSLWPRFTWQFRRRTARFDPSDYVLSERSPAPARAALAA